MTRRICAWCGIVLDEGDGPDDRVSHGICEECAKKIEEMIREEEDDGDGQSAAPR